MWLTVSLAVPTLLLQPWLKADVAPSGMDFSEAVCTSSSPLEQGVSKEPHLCCRSAGWRHSDFGFFLQFPLQAQNPAVQKVHHATLLQQLVAG